MTNLDRDKPLRMADAAVDGLVAGISSGVLMAIFLLAAQWALQGEAPGVSLARFDPGAQPDAVSGLLVHLAVSAVYGLFFGWLAWLLDGRLPLLKERWLALASGGLYGSAIFLVALLTFAQRSGPALFGFSPLIFWLAHLLYGGLLALFLSRAWGRTRAARGMVKLIE